MSGDVWTDVPDDAEPYVLPSEDGLLERLAEALRVHNQDPADALLPVVESYVQQRMLEISRASRARVAALTADRDDWRQRAIDAERAQGIAEADRADTVAALTAENKRLRTLASRWLQERDGALTALDRMLAEATAENERLRGQVEAKHQVALSNRRAQQIAFDHSQEVERALADAETRLAALTAENERLSERVKNLRGEQVAGIHYMRRAEDAEARLAAVETVLTVQEEWCSAERVDVPSWVGTVRAALDGGES